MMKQNAGDAFKLQKEKKESCVAPTDRATSRRLQTHHRIDDRRDSQRHVPLVSIQPVAGRVDLM